LSSMTMATYLVNYWRLFLSRYYLDAADLTTLALQHSSHSSQLVCINIGLRQLRKIHYWHKLLYIAQKLFSICVMHWIWRTIQCELILCYSTSRHYLQWLLAKAAVNSFHGKHSCVIYTPNSKLYPS